MARRRLARRRRPDQRRERPRRSRDAARPRRRRGRLPAGADAQPRRPRHDAADIRFADLLGEVRGELAEAMARAAAVRHRRGAARPRPRDRLRQDGGAEPGPARPPRRAGAARPAAPRGRQPQELHRPGRGRGRPAAPAPERLPGSLAAVAWAAARGAPSCASTTWPRPSSSSRLAGDRRAGRSERRARHDPARFLELLTWRDAVDVLVVAIVIYNLLLLIRGTRAVQMLLGHRLRGPRLLRSPGSCRAADAPDGCSRTC